MMTTYDDDDDYDDDDADDDENGDYDEDDDGKVQMASRVGIIAQQEACDCDTDDMIQI